jgi:hypothetical protein
VAVVLRPDAVFLRAAAFAVFLTADAVFRLDAVLFAAATFFLPADRVVRPALRRVVTAFRRTAFRLAAFRLAISSSFLRPNGSP